VLESHVSSSLSFTPCVPVHLIGDCPVRKQSCIIITPTYGPRLDAFNLIRTVGDLRSMVYGFG
jgi:hypothetical protein